MRLFSVPLVLALGLPALPYPAGKNHVDNERHNNQTETHFTCPANSVHTTGNLPAFSIANVNGNMVYLNSRVASNRQAFYAPPVNKVLVITDIIVQNRAPGDEPVAETQFTRFSITSPAGLDTFLTVVGNRTFSEHFLSGLVIPSLFRFMNVTNSSAPFVEVVITGTLRDCTAS